MMLARSPTAIPPWCVRVSLSRRSASSDHSRYRGETASRREASSAVSTVAEIARRRSSRRRRPRHCCDGVRPHRRAPISSRARYSIEQRERCSTRSVPSMQVSRSAAQNLVAALGVLRRHAISAMPNVIRSMHQRHVVAGSLRPICSAASISTQRGVVGHENASRVSRVLVGDDRRLRQRRQTLGYGDRLVEVFPPAGQTPCSTSRHSAPSPRPSP